MDNVTVANAVATATVSHGSFSPAILDTVKTWIAYVGVLATAIVVAYTGVRKALKDLRGDSASPALMNPGGPAAHAGVQNIVGGTIMETTTLLMWSESNRSVAEALADLTKAVECLPDEMDVRYESITNAINYNTTALRDVVRELSETRHQIERVRDKMP